MRRKGGRTIDGFRIRHVVNATVPAACVVRGAAVLRSDMPLFGTSLASSGGAVYTGAILKPAAK